MKSKAVYSLELVTGEVVTVLHSVDSNNVNALGHWISVRNVSNLQASRLWIEVDYKPLEIYKPNDKMENCQEYLNIRHTCLE